MVLLLLSGLVQAQDLPTYTCWKTDLPPVIDGKGDDEVWRQTRAMELVDVRFLSGDRFPSRPTQVRMAWDDQAIYLLFTAEDPDVWSVMRNRDDHLWNEEVVEIFADPDGDGLNYAEIEVNSLGTVLDLLMSRPWKQGGTGDFSWNPAHEVAVHVEGSPNDPSDEDQYWSTEMALPWEAFRAGSLDVAGDRSLPPAPGDQWRFNFYRYERIRKNGEETEVEYSAWSPVGRVDFHVPERFGIVVFAQSGTAVEPATWGETKQRR